MDAAPATATAPEAGALDAALRAPHLSNDVDFFHDTADADQGARRRSTCRAPPRIPVTARFPSWQAYS